MHHLWLLLLLLLLLLMVLLRLLLLCCLLLLLLLLQVVVYLLRDLVLLLGSHLLMQLWLRLLLLLLLLRLCLRCRNMVDLYLIVCRWSTGRPRRDYFTDVCRPLNEHIFATEISSTCHRRRRRRGRVNSGAIIIASCGRMHDRRCRTHADDLRMLMLLLLQLVTERMELVHLLLLLLKWRGRDNTDWIRLTRGCGSVAAGGHTGCTTRVHLAHNDRRLRSAAGRYDSLRVDQSSSDLAYLIAGYSQRPTKACATAAPTTVRSILFGTVANNTAGRDPATAAAATTCASGATDATVRVGVRRRQEGLR